MKSFAWVTWVVFGLVLLIGGGLIYKAWQGNQVVGHNQYRFNMALIEKDKGVSFVSFDPTEKSILYLPFPSNLAINSRSRGEYSISSLYKLGSYNGSGGSFARQKIQGFMRVPIPGYLVTNNSKLVGKSYLRISLLKIILGRMETSLTRFDAIALLSRVNKYSFREVSEDELLRVAVIEKKDNEYLYHSERLQDYVGTRLFDWGIGAQGVSVAILNASGENGLGSDMADFLSNLGLDVVMVRSAPEGQVMDKSEWVMTEASRVKEFSYIFCELFGFDDPKVEQVSAEYRSQVLIRVGKDAKELF